RLWYPCPRELFYTYFIEKLLSMTKKEGQILIGDVAFKTREMLNMCKQDNRERYDSDEFYYVYAEVKSAWQDNCQCACYRVSHGGGVLNINKKYKKRKVGVRQ